MLQAFVITAREGIEAFLIVALSLAYLRRAGRGELVTAVHWGLGAALVLSLAGGYLLYSAANQEWLEGPLAIIAAVSVAVLTVQMWRAGKRMKGSIEGRLRESSERPGAAAFLGVFLFTLLMISREGMETVLLLMQVQNTRELLAGAVLGTVGAAALAWLWSRYGQRVPLTPFLQMTAIFLLVFVVKLLISGVHEMSEQHMLPYSDGLHASTEAWGPDSLFGHALTYLMVLLPLAWLLVTSWRPRREGRAAPAASTVSSPAR
jgi:high-affinity iron transporter